MPSSTDTNIDLILAALGKDATMLLVERCGGQHHRIPKKPPVWLVEAIGRDAAAQLCQLYGDTFLRIPMAKAWKRQERDRDIRADFDPPKNLTVHQLVRKYELCDSTIRAILNNVDTPVNAAMPRFGGLAHRRDADTVDMFLTEGQS
jgi:hypothetical protein